MVKSQDIYSPQNYLLVMTGKCYMYDENNDVKFIRENLVKNGYSQELQDFSLSEINHIVENDLDVVLVDCMVVNPETDQFEHQYRWFQVPEYFKEEINYEI